MKNLYTMFRSLWSKALVLFFATLILGSCKSGSKTESSAKSEVKKEEIRPTESGKTGNADKDSMYNADPKPVKEAPKPGRGPK